jgi:beta-glucosidase
MTDFKSFFNNTISHSDRPFIPFLLGAVFFFACTPSEPLVQPELKATVVPILDIEGHRYKDLNRNNALDPYEDWRLASEERALNLLSQMSLEEKVGFMIIGTTRLENESGFVSPSSADLPITDGFNEKDFVSDRNFFTRAPMNTTFMAVAGTTKAVRDFHSRHFIFRSNPPVTTMARWHNRLQQLCEEQPLGIPAIVTSNPRNHIASDAAVGLSLGKTTFTQWPGELGLSATRDLELIETFADMARQEWRAVGLRKGYMYMADLSTEPRWQRIEGTFGEDPDWVAQVITSIVKGFQGPALGAGSVAMTIKHFPGGGATAGGQDPHFKWGRKALYEGGAFERHLIPFKAAIDAGTSSIMPYYSFPVNTVYDTLGFAFNKPVITDLLRNKLGFQGVINSDTGPIRMMPWGVEKLTIAERYTLALEAGINLFSGSADPTELLETVRANPSLLPYVDDSVKRLLIEKFELGLFENPYVDVEDAEKIVGNPNFKEKAQEAHQKSIVLLRNSPTDQGTFLPLPKRTKLYVEVGGTFPEVLNRDFGDDHFEWVTTPEEATVILHWIVPKGKSLFDSRGQPISIRLSDNNVDVASIQKWEQKKPTLLVINYTNPWVIDEVYNESTTNVKGVLATFGTTLDAVLDVLSGRVNPSGKMPFSTPISTEVVPSQKADIPGFEEGEDYALFNYNEGLRYAENP